MQVAASRLGLYRIMTQQTRVTWGPCRNRDGRHGGLKIWYDTVLPITIEGASLSHGSEITLWDYDQYHLTCFISGLHYFPPMITLLVSTGGLEIENHLNSREKCFVFTCSTGPAEWASLCIFHFYLSDLPICYLLLLHTVHISIISVYFIYCICINL